MFIKRFKLFNLLGFPVYVDLSWFLIVLLITWSLADSVFPSVYEGFSRATYWWMGLAGALGLFVSILAHELGHATVARRYDVPMRGITLFIFGGVAEMSREPPSAKAEFFVAIAGPIVSVVLAAACYTISVVGKSGLPGPIAGVFWYLGMINAVVVAFNLIPAFPLDGGRVLRSILWHFQGDLQSATRITAGIGSAFGLLLIMLGIFSFIGGNVVGGMWQFLIGMFLRGAAQMSYQQVLIRRALEGEPVDRFMHADVVTVPPTISVRQLVDNYIYKYHHKMLPVTDNDRLVGCVTTRDIQQVPRGEWDQHSVEEILKPCADQNTVQVGTDAMQALARMSRNQASRLMVVRDGHLEGILSLKDLMKFISLKIELEEGDDVGIEESPAALAGGGVAGNGARRPE
jgi:Zn-dependent protease/predicted transcriptional regulator